MTSQTVRRVAPLAAGAAVLVLVAGSTYLLRDGGAAPGSADLPLLRIGAGAAAADFASTKGRVVVSTTLPAGPDSARVYRFGSARPDRAKLADALGLRPGQVRTGDAVAADQGTVLRVGTGRGAPWEFARAGAYVCLDQLVDGTDGANSTMRSVCAAPPPSDQPTPSNPPSEAMARDAARPVLSSVGLDADDAVIESATTRGTAVSSRTVRVDPPVDGSPTSGLTTSVTVDADGVLTAEGWLGVPRASDRYPVITAQEAVDRLAAMPVPLMACPESIKPVPPGPVCGGPMEITAASVGLSLQWESGRALLVPSWLFDILGGAEPIAIVAVDPAYLADPLSTHQGNGASGSGSGVPGSPGTADPASPATPEPPAVEPTATTSRFASVAPANGDAALRVTFYGGVDSCYTYDIVVKESADEVTLRLVEKRTADICIDMAQQYERIVKLSRPLGERRVFDAATESVLYPDRTD